MECLMNTLQGAWAGRMYGTNTGNVFLEFSQSENQLNGIARLHDDKFGIAVYSIEGSIIEGKIEIKGMPKQAPDGVELGDATIVGELKQDGSIAGRWETTIGSAGTIRLFPHKYEDKVIKTTEPEQIYNVIKPIGSVRLFKKDIKSLFDVIEKDFTEGRLVVTYTQRGNEVTRYASDFLEAIEKIEEIRSLKIFIQEQESPGINKMVNVDLFEKINSAIRVSGINESWVVGKAESINNEISRYQNRVITNYRKYGLNLNQIIFFLMLVLIPEISTWPKRLLFVGAVYTLLVSLFGVHTKLIPNTIILAEDKPLGYIGRSWPSIVSWLIAFSSSLVAALLFWLLTKAPN